MIDNLKDGLGNNYYQKYTTSNPPLSLEMAYEKIAEMIKLWNDNFNRINILEDKVKILEEEKRLLENLRK